MRCGFSCAQPISARTQRIGPSRRYRQRARIRQLEATSRPARPRRRERARAAADARRDPGFGRARRVRLWLMAVTRHATIDDALARLLAEQRAWARTLRRLVVSENE